MRAENTVLGVCQQNAELQYDSNNQEQKGTALRPRQLDGGRGCSIAVRDVIVVSETFGMPAKIQTKEDR